jgi:hypothetical protein
VFQAIAFFSFPQARTARRSHKAKGGEKNTTLSGVGRVLSIAEEKKNLKTFRVDV